MDNQSIQKITADLQIAATNIQSVIKRIQDACPHDSYTVMMYSWGPGRFNPARICDWCRGIAGEASCKETEQCLADLRGQTTTGVSTTIVEQEHGSD